jgi:hypothetical protein
MRPEEQNDAAMRETTLSGDTQHPWTPGTHYAQTRGTVEAEINNLGRHMIAVRWDNGLEMYVFPDEIEIDDKARNCNTHAN